MEKICPTHKDIITGKIKQGIKCHSHKFFFRKWLHNIHCAILHCPHAKSIFVFEFWKFIKKINAKLHLKYKCPKCNFRKRFSRDIFDTGECHWYAEWKKGNYDVPMNMGLVNYFRVIFLRYKINHKHVYWKHMPKSERILRYAVTSVIIIGIVFLFIK